MTSPSAPAAMPSDETLALIIDGEAFDPAGDWAANADRRLAAQRKARLVRELFAPVVAEKERLEHMLGEKFVLAASKRAIEAETALASLRQDILDADILCDDDEKAGDRLSRLAAAIRAGE